MKEEIPTKDIKFIPNCDDVCNYCGIGSFAHTHTQLDYKKMVEEVNELVENDFCFEMELKLMSKSKLYTQEEAERMANIISKIYTISHCIGCGACQTKYKL